ncbi:MAG: Zn-ribbon domain-containing OB-fold protein [Actinobacteria bacterium]|nr:Zn-ribbon domain-containing OB-fold protein [Actinomycetota bacterium]MBU1945199.1 Zn-ribbon domain-containing OB-fold protein [Actinomycetota bacterium]MBU2687737.1 Zn-ribbon domain-containing OB-fold protein [Actinomycetota bacterium]
MTALERIVTTSVVPLDFTYNYRVGPYLENYIQGLGRKKILGSKCPDCGKVVVPPRKVCGLCNAIMDAEGLVECGPEGTVDNFTVGHVAVVKGLIEKLDVPQVLAMVVLDGASVPLLAELKGVEPSAVARGMKVKAVFRDPTENDLSDLSHFEPV